MFLTGIFWPAQRREKSRLCATIAAYFRSVQAIREILFSLVASDGKTPEGSRHMRADDLLEILKPVSAQIDEERLPALGRLFQDLADGFLTNPAAPPTSAGGGPGLDRPHGDRGNFAGCGWADRAAAGSSGSCTAAVPPECGDVFHRWQGEVYYTVLRRPLSQDLPRGSTFSPGLRTRPAWMSPACSGWRMSLWGWRICARGSFLRNCWTSSSPVPTREAALPAARPREETMVSGYSYLLQEAFEQYGRGMG